MAVGTGVTSFHKDYTCNLIKWKRVRDVCAGEDAVHAAAEAYLPRLVDEPNESYLARIARTPFFNASWRTVASFVGMIFRIDATLDIDDSVKPLLDDVSMSGVSFDAMARDVVLEGFETSRCGILVDHPSQQKDADGNIVIPTKLVAEKLGLRPSMTFYKTEAIYNWDHRRINNKTVLSEVRLIESETVPNPGNPFLREEKKRARVLDLDDQGLYRVRRYDWDTEEQLGEDIYPTINGQKLDYIPFYPITPDGAEIKPDDPVLLDLFNHNIKHYQVSASYEHACFMTGLPTPWVTGYTAGFDDKGTPVKESFYIGSATAWVFPDKDTKVGFLEYQGGGIASIKANLDDKKAEMAQIGASALSPEKAGVEAPETLLMRNAGEHSILGSVSIASSDGLVKALTTFCLWAGSAKKPDYKLNRDFMPFSIDPQQLTAWLALVQAGKMTDEELFILLQRGDLIDKDVEYEAHKAVIDANPPPAPITATGNPNNPNNPNNPKPKPKPIAANQ